jgi:hypothetical protein
LNGLERFKPTSFLKYRLINTLRCPTRGVTRGLWRRMDRQRRRQCEQLSANPAGRQKYHAECVGFSDTGVRQLITNPLQPLLLQFSESSNSFTRRKRNASQPTWHVHCSTKSHAFLLSTLRCAGRRRSVSGQERGIRSGLASSRRLSRLLFRSTEARTPHRTNRCRFFWEANHGLTKDFKPLPDIWSTAIRALHQARVDICRRVRESQSP